MKRVKQHCSVGATVVGTALESVVQVLLKSVSSQQWGALIRTSTSTVLLLLSRLTWSSTSVFWLPILPKEQIQYAPLSWQFKKRKGHTTSWMSLFKMQRFPFLSPLSHCRYNNVHWTPAPESRWKASRCCAVLLCVNHYIKQPFIPLWHCAVWFKPQNPNIKVKCKSLTVATH